MAVDTPHKTLSSVPLDEVCANEYVAIEVLENGGYDTQRHPVMARRRFPVYQRENDEWTLLSSYDDELFETVGAVKHRSAIAAFLDTLSCMQFADFDAVAYNAQAGENALVPGVDYTASAECTLPKTQIEEKQYYIVDGYTYALCARSRDPAALVDVVSFDHVRVPDIEREEQRKYDEMMAKKTHNLSVDSELGQFAVSILARDFIVLQYDVERNVYAPKHASTTLIYLLYAADKTFFAQLTPEIFKMHTSPRTSTILYSQMDNTTIMVSALLLELLYPDQEARRVQRESLITHNLGVVASKGHVHAMRETEYRYVEIEVCDYEAYYQIFTQALGRTPSADFLY